MKRFNLLAAVLAGCGLAAYYFSNPLLQSVDLPSNGLGIEDLSVSGVVASSLGGAFFATQPGEPSENLCPSLSATTVSGCQNDLRTANAAHLIFDDCSKDGSPMKWFGRLRFSRSDGAPLLCGRHLSPNIIFQNQYVDKHGNPAQGVRQSPNGDRLVIDHAMTSGTLGNFENVSIPPTVGRGYGTSVSFDKDGARVQLSIAQRIVVERKEGGALDQTVLGTVNIRDKRVDDGHIASYDNKLQIVAVSHFSRIKFRAKCCTPVAGTIQTRFSRGANVEPTEEGSRYINKRELLEFIACGQGDYVAIDGTRRPFSLTCF